MAMDESFKRPGSIPFKWELQPGIPKPEHAGASDNITATPFVLPLPPTPPSLAPPPAAAVRTCMLASSASSSRRVSTVSSSAPLSPPSSSASHRRSVSARFATSLVLPFTRRRPRRRGRTEDGADFCLLYREKDDRVVVSYL